MDIVTDFNGTLVAPPTCEPENRRIAYAVKEREIRAVKRGRIWRVGRLVGLLRTKREIERRLHGYKEGQRTLAEVYKPFNTGVLRGEDPNFVRAVLREYAQSLVDDRQVDKGLLRALKESRDGGSRLGILSVAVYDVISHTFDAAGYGGLVPEDQIVSNRILVNGTVEEFTLGVYDEKARRFEADFLKGRGYSDKKTVYVGDTPDDLPVAELLPRGRFVVSRYAEDAFREHAARHYGAATPKNMGELRLALRG